MPKPEYRVSENGIRAHLLGKVEEWIEDVVRHRNFASLEQAEQNFKDWLWGETEGGRDG